MSTLRKHQVFNEINITPLTDIFLVLLIIMMVVAPMLETSGLKLAVPSIGPADDIKEDPKTIAVRIDAENHYFVEDQAVASNFLFLRIKELKKEKPEGVVIATSPDATHEALAKAMDAAQVAGVTKVAVTQAQ